MNDIPVHRGGFVFPDKGGMSVNPNSWKNIHETLRDQLFDSEDDCRVWWLFQGELGSHLKYRADRKIGGHGFIEPSHGMTLQQYEKYLADTKKVWRVYYMEQRKRA